MKTREEILAKAAECESVEDDSIEQEVQSLLLEIAGEDEASMLDEDAREDLLKSMDIYHGQTQAVRMVRTFLS